MLNIVISILKLKELAVILERWKIADARKHMPDGHDRLLRPLFSLKARAGPSRSSWDSFRFQTALALPSLQSSSCGTTCGGRVCNVDLFEGGLPAPDTWDAILEDSWKEGEEGSFPKSALPQ